MHSVSKILLRSEIDTTLVSTKGVRNTYNNFAQPTCLFQYTRVKIIWYSQVSLQYEERGREMTLEYLEGPVEQVFYKPPCPEVTPFGKQSFRLPQLLSHQLSVQLVIWINALFFIPGIYIYFTKTQLRHFNLYFRNRKTCL